MALVDGNELHLTLDVDQEVHAFGKAGEALEESDDLHLGQLLLFGCPGEKNLYVVARIHVEVDRRAQCPRTRRSAGAARPPLRWPLLSRRNRNL